MLRVALTGGLVCGKSTVLEIFRQLGASAISADEIVHQLYTRGEPVYQAVAQQFGSSVLTPSGEIDRRKLAAAVFNDPKQRELLEGTVHPRVIDRQKQWLRELESQRDAPSIAIIEIPLLFEKNLQAQFHKTIAVICGPELKLERFRNRHPQLSRTEAQEEIGRRSSAQMSDEKKAQMSDYVIENSGSRAGLKARVQAVFQKLRQDAASSPG